MEVSCRKDFLASCRPKFLNVITFRFDPNIYISSQSKQVVPKEKGHKVEMRVGTAVTARVVIQVGPVAAEAVQDQVIN